MERLTEYSDHGIMLRKEVDINVVTSGDFDNLQHVLSRLAAYENSGLEPDDILSGLLNQR